MRFAPLLIAGIAAGLFAPGLAAAEAPDAGLAALLERIPDVKANSRFVGPDQKDADEIFAAILKGGPANIVGLVDQVLEPGKGLDFRPRYALHGLAHYVARPGREADRRMLVGALVSTLDGKRPKAVQGFIIRQLHVIRDGAAAAPLGKFLLDAELCDYAARALVAIGGEAAAAELRKALPSAKGAARLTLVQALGGVRDTQSVGALTAALGDGDRDVRLAAALSLAEIADPAAVAPVLKAADAEPLFERSRAAEACLLLGRRLVAAGQRAEAARVYEYLWRTRAALEDRHVRCAALHGLADTPGTMALDTLVAALASEDSRIRDAAALAAARMPGEDATRRWLAELRAAPAEKRAPILAILGRRSDPLGLPMVLAAMKDKDRDVRLAAISAAGRIGGKDAVAALLVLLDDRDGRVRGAARGACERVGGKDALRQMAEAVAGASGQAKRELLAVLVARAAVDHLDVVLAAARDQDESVRAQAVRAVGALGGEEQVARLLRWLVGAKSSGLRRAAEEALASAGRKAADKNRVAGAIAKALDGAPAPTRAALLRALGQIAAPAALDPIRGALKDADAEVRDAAVRTLANWPNASPASDLLAIAKSTDSESHHVLALRGYLRMIRERGGAESPESQIAMCEEALRAARRPDEKKQALGVLSNIRTPRSLGVVTRLLADAGIAEEAGAAAVRIAGRLRREDGAAVGEAMKKVLAACKDERVRRDAQKVAERFAPKPKLP